jgi:hypothetical protein
MNLPVTANRLTSCFKAEIPGQLPEVYLVRLTLVFGKELLSQNDYWMSSKNGSFGLFNQTARASLSVKLVKQDNSRSLYRVTNTSKIPAIGVKFNLVDSAKGKPILPAIFSDGYFTLLPGEKKEISVDSAAENGTSCRLVWEGINL